MKKNQTYQIEARSIPDSINQHLEYKSLDESIASVSSDGCIKAQNYGCTSIIVSNYDACNSIIVVVNNNKEINENNKPYEFFYSNSHETEKAHNNNNNSDEILRLTCDEYPRLDSEFLKNIYNNKNVVEIESENYCIILSGADINNFNNELNTIITFTHNENGIEFVVNDNNELCGKIKIILLNSDLMNEYSCAAEPPVRCGESHQSGL